MIWDNFLYHDILLSYWCTNESLLEAKLIPVHIHTISFGLNMQGYGNTMPDMSSLSHFPVDRNQFTCHRTKDFIAVAKKTIQIMRYIFIVFLKENVCGYSFEVPHRDTSKCEALQRHFKCVPICFLREIRIKAAQA